MKVILASIFAVFAVAAFAFATGPVKITGSPHPYSALDMKGGSGVLHEYYIGLHSPGGDCVTKVIKAETLSEAFAKGARNCKDCAIYDLTGNFTGKRNNALALQSMRYCPISETRK